MPSKVIHTSLSFTDLDSITPDNLGVLHSLAMSRLFLVQLVVVTMAVLFAFAVYADALDTSTSPSPSASAAASSMPSASPSPSPKASVPPSSSASSLGGFAFEALPDFFKQLSFV
nr:hypothetical protein [Pandoravirus aubagnensis]